MQATLEHYLVETGIVDAQEMAEAQKLAAQTGQSLVSALRQTSSLAGDDVARTLAAYYRIEVAADEDWPRTPLLSDTLSYGFLRASHILPLAETPDGVVLAVADPSDVTAIEAVRLAVDRPLLLRLAAREEIEAAIERLTSTSDEAAEITAAPADFDDDVEHLKDMALGAPVVRLVNQLLLDAVRARATDLHVEPFHGRLTVRIRVDGRLRELRSPPAEMSNAVVSRLKILCGLNIAERRVPQDGRARIRIDARRLDLRIATMPTINGEAVAIRLLDNVQRVLELSRLGFGERDEALLRHHLSAPHGLVLVTGPTGSGKTTTLATALTILNAPHRKILTIEDPIEYQIDGINQTQVKPDIGVTFASSLRAFLRHDPDVIMVGEMRDPETAHIAVHAALTGHIVLSTLHTNSAPGAVTRLLDMGVDGYLLASSLRCVIGQRLVRLLCTSCREPYRGVLDFPPKVLQQAGLAPGQQVELWRAKGCDRCSGTGYVGRIGIIEALDVDDTIRQLIRPDVATSDIARAAMANGMVTMAADGLRKCLAGLTSTDEVRHATLEQ